MPSAKVLEAKKAQVAEVVEILKAAQTGVLVDYRGLTVDEDTDLRNKLRAANVKYFVMKNTLLRLAADETGLNALDETLHGPTAIAVSSEDAVAPAKETLIAKIMGSLNAPASNLVRLLAAIVDEGVEPAELAAKKQAEGAAEEAPAAEEAAPAAEEAPAEEAKAEEAPAAEEAAPADAE